MFSNKEDVIKLINKHESYIKEIKKDIHEIQFPFGSGFQHYDIHNLITTLDNSIYYINKIKNELNEFEIRKPNI